MTSVPMSGESAGRVLWQTDGPIVSRICTQSGDETTVREMPMLDGPLDVAVREMWVLLPTLRDRFVAQGEHLNFPHVFRTGGRIELRYANPGARLMSNQLEAGELPTEVITGLSALLILIHKTPVPPTLRTAPPVAPLADGWGTKVTPSLKAPLHASGLLARARSARERLRRPVFLHGRWSTGSVLLNGDSWTMLSGVEFWHGPAEYDLGFMLSELVELAADGLLAGDNRRVETALRLGTLLVIGYSKTMPVDTAALIDWTAHRLAEHLVLNEAWRRHQGGVLPSETEWHAATVALSTSLELFEEVLR